MALVAGLLLFLAASSPRAAVAAAVYSLSLVGMFSFSALYNVPNWRPAVADHLRRLDHATIFVLIAGSYTPFCMLALQDHGGMRLLSVVWAGAAVGILHSVSWVRAPRMWRTTLCLVLGWLAVPYIPAMWAALGTAGFSLLAGGGLLFTAGAVIYVLRWPDPLPAVFGYHEVFHALVVVACGCQFAAAALLITRA